MKIETLATFPVATPATRFMGLLKDLCNARLAIDAFHESQDGEIMKDRPGFYLTADSHLGEAIAALSEYVGEYLVDEYLTTGGHE
jgi:hypothetical protein